MKDFTILTIINHKYLDMLRKTHKTWSQKKELQNKPTIILYTDIEPNELSFINAEKHKWDMKEYSTTREKILSGFLYGAANHIKTEYYLKIDADTYFTDDRPLFDNNTFNYDIIGQKWRYTKPGTWIDTLDNWADTKNIPGNKFNTTGTPAKNCYRHKRFSSLICMHKMDFIREAISYSPNRMPIPSHDTYLWYMANRLPHRKWGRTRFPGIRHSKRGAMALPNDH